MVLSSDVIDIVVMVYFTTPCVGYRGDLASFGFVKTSRLFQNNGFFKIMVNTNGHYGTKRPLSKI